MPLVEAVLSARTPLGRIARRFFQGAPEGGGALPDDDACDANAARGDPADPPPPRAPLARPPPRAPSDSNLSHLAAVMGLGVNGGGDGTSSGDSTRDDVVHGAQQPPPSSRLSGCAESLETSEETAALKVSRVPSSPIKSSNMQTAPLCGPTTRRDHSRSARARAHFRHRASRSSLRYVDACSRPRSSNVPNP